MIYYYGRCFLSTDARRTHFYVLSSSTRIRIRLRRTRMTTDITLTNVRTTLSLVDKKKLEKAEQRRARRLADQNARERVVEQWGGYEEMDDDVDEDDDMFQNTLMDPTLGKGILFEVWCVCLPFVSCVLCMRDDIIQARPRMCAWRTLTLIVGGHVHVL